MPDNLDIETLIDDMAAGGDGDASAQRHAQAVRPPRRDIPSMMRKIPVTLTLEVGSASILLHDLMQIGPDSVVELDRLAGEPLLIKVNGTPIGRAEVVAAGENYGLRVIDLDGLDLDSLTR